MARPRDRLSAILRPDNPSARSRRASRIFRIGNLFIGFLSAQNERKNNHVKDRLAAAISQVKTGWPDAPESPAGLNRYGWPDTIGISGRMIPECAVSDGTIKMFAYLTLLYDPEPHPLLCVEEPENQLYPTLLWELAEEFRSYAERGGQVFVSTHSPDFLNAVNIDEVYWLVKKDGYTTLKRARDDAQLKAFIDEGDQMGYLWKEDLFQGANPQ